MLFINPVTTDDHFRYLWDGKVQNEGVNPFKFSPSELTIHHDDTLYQKVPYPETKTIYPPLSQAVFFLSYKFFGVNVYGLKLIYLLFEAGTLIFLYMSLKILKINSNYIFLYSFSPLVIFEFFINAHIDVLILFFIMGSVYFALNKNSNYSMLLLGFSVLSKVYTLIFLPVYLICFFQQEKSIKNVLLNLLFFLIPFSLLIFYADGINNIFFQMFNYLKYWQFNNLPFTAINTFLELFKISNFSTVRLILIMLFFILYILILSSKFNFIQKIYLAVFCYLFLSPTVHPWYLTVLVLLLPLYFNFTIYYWSGIIGFTNITVYYYLKDKQWFDITIVLLIQYILMFILAVFDLKKLKSKLSFAATE